MRSIPIARCNSQWRRRSSAPVASNCCAESLPAQYPSVARFNSRAAPRGGKPKFEAIVIGRTESYGVMTPSGTRLPNQQVTWGGGKRRELDFLRISAVARGGADAEAALHSFPEADRDVDPRVPLARPVLPARPPVRQRHARVPRQPAPA